jgi:4-oxalocrotonate tautomerase
MPHIIVKMYLGRSEQQKARLAEAIVKDVTAITNMGDDAVSVTIEEAKADLGREGLQAGHRERLRQAL